MSEIQSLFEEMYGTELSPTINTSIMVAMVEEV
jgi:hypothetical protein